MGNSPEIRQRGARIGDWVEYEEVDGQLRPVDARPPQPPVDPAEAARLSQERWEARQAQVAEWMMEIRARQNPEANKTQ